MLISPPFLKPGDTIAITAPASKLELKNIEVGVEILQNWGLKTIIGKTVGSAFNNFSASDEVRKAELQQYLDDVEVKMIIAARGGYGCSRFIDNIDFTLFKNQAKWIIGFSDITTILLKINSLGFQALHGAMVKTLAFDHESNESLKNLLFGDGLHYHWETHEYNKTGKGMGEAVGGNLALIAHNLGSDADIDFDGKILFLEDISEYYYNIDRMMLQLKRAGKLRNLAGMVIGDFSDCKDNDEPFGKRIEEIILDHTQGSSYPVAFNFGFGHENRNLAVRMGETLSLEVSDQVILKSI